MKFFTNMFDAWFKPKFHSKCNSYITVTLLRIEMIKRRRNAMQKYLRSDIAELIKMGLDSDAYGRVGRLYLDQLRSLSYDFVGQFCTLVSNHLKTINDQSECPEECKEAIPSLMYAAARFGDLPELRKLRSLFSEKYRSSLESFVNKEFIGLLKPNQPTKDTKIQLMQEIAVEYGVEWDSKSFERKLYKISSSGHDCSENANDHKNDRMVSIQEITTDDNKDHQKDDPNGNKDQRRDDPNDEIEKQTRNMRQRILDYLSRITNLQSTSGDTTTSSEESSSNSSTNEEKDDGNKENEGILNYPKGVWDDETTTNSCVKNMRRRKGGLRVRKGPEGHARAGSYQPDSTMNPPTRHVHPKLPTYDDIIARFAALRAKS